MPLSFKSAGTYATGGAPEANPNAGAPAAARILELPDRSENGRVARDLRGYIKFTGAVGTPTIDFTAWVLDEATGNWVKSLAITGAEDDNGFQVANLAPGRVTFTVDAETGTFTSVEFFAAAA